LNLCFEVLGKRQDGLHEVATVLQSVSLVDVVRCSEAQDISLSCREMAVTPENLILRAAHLLKSATGATAGAAITCVKRIPVGGGLGGGSADAAATLRALNDLWE
jgi:4-diphosphocytidyl-2-C-methyl-D-erythritol kinase